MSDCTKIRKILWICGFNPKEDGALPTFFQVGANGVSKIEAETEDYGDHGLGWFNVYFGDELLQRMAARAVAEIRYFPADADLSLKSEIHNV